jgi:hypothetical protein
MTPTWLLTWSVCVCVCVCVRRKPEREGVCVCLFSRRLKKVPGSRYFEFLRLRPELESNYNALPHHQTTAWERVGSSGSQYRGQHAKGGSCPLGPMEHEQHHEHARENE